MTDEHLKLWNKCLAKIKDNLPEDVFEYWFSPLKPVSLADGVLVLRAPSDYFVQMYEDRFYNVLLGSIKSVYGKEVTKLRYQLSIVSGDDASEVQVESVAKSKVVNNKVDDLSRRTADPFAADTGEDIKPKLMPEYNFDNYCVGESNKLPHAIARYIADNPKKSEFNPFFLYGSVGVGKTHLIQAIGIKIKEDNPRAKVLYITTDEFTNQLAIAYMTGKVPDFINFYKGIDVLLIDDLQTLSNKKRNQEALFSIFSYLHLNGKKLIMTSDRPPMELDGLQDRLIDRFKWGVTEVLPKPDRELRRRILLQKMNRYGITMPSDVIDLISEQITESVRELEGVVNSLLTKAITLNAPITRDMALSVIRSSFKAPAPRINFDMIVEATAEYMQMNPDVIFSRSRMRDISDARQIIMYLASKYADLSTTAIGAKLNREHTTVIHGIRNIQSRLSVEKELSETIQLIERRMKR